MEIQLRGNFELFTCTSELWMCTQNVFELEIEQGGVKSRSENTRNRMLHETGNITAHTPAQIHRKIYIILLHYFSASSPRIQRTTLPFL